MACSGCGKFKLFTKNMKSVISHATKTGKVVSNTAYVNRMRICNACDKKKPFKKVLLCTECGCILNVKAQLIASECPIGKWKS